jgi:hypothetical protein
MNDVKGMFLEKFTNELIVWSVFSSDNEDIHLCSAYMPPSKPIEEVLDQINATIDEIKPKNLITSCDTNAKSNVWFSKFNNKRGYDMFKFILKNDLTIMNNPTFFTINRQSHIDLTLTYMNSNKNNSVRAQQKNIYYCEKIKYQKLINFLTIIYILSLSPN